MTKGEVGDLSDSELATISANRVGFYASILTSVLTIVTFGLAMTAIPISGANCREGCPFPFYVWPRYLAAAAA